jgi:type IV pilus assembly protein PilW
VREPASFDITARSDGFSLIELLVSILVSAILLTSFTAFYLSEQRAMRHNQIEIEASQDLRVALEQMSRDLRSAGRNLLAPCTPLSNFVTATEDTVEFQLDANDDGVVTATDVNEHKGFRRTNANDLEEYDAATDTWAALATGITELTFAYRACDGTVLTAPVAAPGTNIATVDISITVNRPIVGGLPVNRTEAESVRLRNVLCGTVDCSS